MVPGAEEDYSAMSQRKKVAQLHIQHAADMDAVHPGIVAQEVDGGDTGRELADDLRPVARYDAVHIPRGNGLNGGPRVTFPVPKAAKGDSSTRRNVALESRNKLHVEGG